MLDVKFYSSNESNEWFVRQFAVFKFSDVRLTEKFIPRPDISIIFHFKNQPSILENDSIQLEPIFVTSITSQSLVLRFEGAMDSFVVICKPIVFTRVFGIDLSPIPKRSVNLSHTAFQPLWTSLSRLTTTEERIACFTEFINSFLSRPYTRDTIDMLYDKMIENGPKLLLKDIFRGYPACQRTLERNFKRRTGVSPKKLMRIVRFDYLWNKINNEASVDYQDLVFDGKFFDQAHFINDFKYITGETPSYFFKRNLQVTKMFSGRTEGTVI